MKKEKRKSLAALGLGALLGGTAGVLLAPKKGSETRAIIKKSIGGIKSKLKNVNNTNIKTHIERKLNEIDLEISKLETEIIFKKAQRRAKKVAKKINNLVKYIKKKGMNDFESLIDDLKDKANTILEEVLTNSK